MPTRNSDPSATPPVAGAAAGDDRWLRAVLFDADGSDHQLAIDEVDLGALSERQLLWVDIQRSDEDNAAGILESLGLGAVGADLDDRDSRPSVQNFGEWFVVRIVSIVRSGKLKFAAQPVTLIVGRNFVVTLHREPLEYVRQLGERECGDTQLGMLSAEALTASVIDWQLTTYFDAVAELEAAIDRLEVHMLAHRVNGTSVPSLARLRRTASRLRRLLVPHRMVFSAMTRPDFRPEQHADAADQFRGLQERFERCLDLVENARDLVIGSFELFATRTAQQTNETMRALTFYTVLLGTLAVLAGVLGMNFDVAIFDTGARGFAIAIASMVVIVVVAVVVARWRHWL